MTFRAKRSLKATLEGISRANKAVLIFATKMDLAAELEISRATVQNFFAGKPVGRENFHKICQKLELPWREIADLSDDPYPDAIASTPSSRDLDSLVQQWRQLTYASIEQRCGSLRVLDMSQPLELHDIYTNVNVLEKISGRRRLEVADLLKVCAATEFDRPGLGRSAVTPVPGLEAVKNFPKLIVLGKPGAGKTTFLKHVALQCNRAHLQPQRLPLFISLKDFAETEGQPGLETYITQYLASCGCSDARATQQLLSAGRALVLLDGLDEVRESETYRVLQAVRQFTNHYHHNHFLISCRLATREYTLEEFTEVEVADFSLAQISSFVSKWFAASAPGKSRRLLRQLQQQPPIQELATSPLLLTLLCLIFEESADFPANRSELYKEGLHVLLRKWDAKRNIERQQLYKKLSVSHKEDLLGQIARINFTRGDYFFRQPQLEQQIADYIRHLPNVNPTKQSLAVDAEAVLKSIEAQHGLLVERARGIYSFSHLTFQEYFTARDLVAAPDPHTLATALQQLVERLSEPRWREVFLLVVEMLRSADYLLRLMKQHADQLLASDPQLQAFLAWVERKAASVSTPYPAAAVRAFYFDLDLARVLELIGGTLALARAVAPTFTRELDCGLALDLALDRTLTIDKVLNGTLNPARLIRRVLARAVARAHVVEPKLEVALQQLREQLPDSTEDRKGFKLWWNANGQAWTEQLRTVMISDRQLGYPWQFSARQQQLLQQYYYANNLLVDCLNSNCYVTSKVRQEIKETLLLPSSSLGYPSVETTFSVVS